MPRIALDIALPFTTLAEARAHYARIHRQIWGPPPPIRILRPPPRKLPPPISDGREQERIALAIERTATCLQLTMVIAVVADVWGVMPANLIAHDHAFDRPRGIVIALGCRLLHMSYRQIGSRLERKHSTIRKTARRYDRLIEEALHGRV